MIERKKKLRIIQFFLLIFAILIIYLTYYSKEISNVDLADSEQVKKTLKDEDKDDENLFFDIEYTGLDLRGNRYLLKSKKARLDELKPEIIYMEDVHAIFYFKDNTILYIWSDEGIYNNKNFDMEFSKNVEAEYLDSKLFAEKANYSNTENYLSIYENVRINDIRGNLIADKLLFDIKKQNLAITSFNDGKINANVKLNEKRF
ncbi:LPS export ABC transporter periplasmic protein LptC [Pelagibacterales bacterium SAG-MED05]|nr:LPS export ABC transporter periplasmic protein LptC [Pelagibacterales bacterium SAG-MED05]